jgi:SAM-dependent methyltransferase
MKICRSCNHHFDSPTWVCPRCGWSANFNNGIYQLRDITEDLSIGYQDSYFAPLSEVEVGNFWFEGRNRLIIHTLRKFAPNMHSFIEIGCGTGFVLTAISQFFPHTRLVGAEYFAQGLDIAKSRVSNADFYLLDARDMPFQEEFDVVGLFDVIEHIKEDEQTLREVARTLKTNGLMIITVPQHQFLWSTADEYKNHERRYDRDDLIDKVERAGMEVLYTTSFVTFLLPIMLLSRVWQNRSTMPADRMKEFSMPPLINAIFNQLMRVETALTKLGLQYRLGGSRLLIARKFNADQ